MNIAYITSYDPFNVSGWEKGHWGFHSAGRWLAKELSEYPLQLHLNRGSVPPSSRVKRLRERFSELVGRGKYYEFCDDETVRLDAANISKFLKTIPFDFILAPENCLFFGHESLRDLPRIVYTDTPIGALIDFYPNFCGLSSTTRKNILRWEHASLSSARHIIYYTPWAKQRAMELYQIPAEKISVIPGGANISIRNFITPVKPPDSFRLGLVSSRWDHKGGDFAIAVVAYLRKNFQMDVVLDIIGDGPHPKNLPTFVHLHGWIDKTSVPGERLFQEILSGCHLLIHPTIADTFGHVIVEANAYGVPAVVRGLPCMKHVIKEGKNGLILPRNAEVPIWANVVATLLRDGEKLRTLSKSSYETFVDSFSWKKSSAKLVEKFNSLLPL